MNAVDISNTHLRLTNPSMWDGKGARPGDFDPRARTYDVSPERVIDVSFDRDEGEWGHYCQLRDRGSEKIIDAAHGYGVDSPRNLADTIDYLVSVN